MLTIVLAGLLACPVCQHLPIGYDSGYKLTASLRAYSYGDSSGFTPDSLLMIFIKRSTDTRANVGELAQIKKRQISPALLVK